MKKKQLPRLTSFGSAFETLASLALPAFPFWATIWMK